MATKAKLAEEGSEAQAPQGNQVGKDHEGNLALWNLLGRTDPDQTKDFVRGGGFRGTAIKPIYTHRKMTDIFGPVGIGWGMSEPEVTYDFQNSLVFVKVGVWYMDGAKRSDLVWGIGGDKLTSSKGVADDEAVKKAYTDAVGNALRYLGMSADVHMGLFEDSKYVQDARDEAQDTAAKEAFEREKAKLDAILSLVKLAPTNAAVDTMMIDHKKTVQQINAGPNKGLLTRFGAAVKEHRQSLPDFKEKEQ